MPTTRRLPISSRHAFALAFDLAFRRDFVQSIAVPLLLQTPWFIVIGRLPSLEESRAHLLQVTLLTAFTLVAQSFTGLLVMAMLRFRARSVFNTPPTTQPAAAGKCYAQAVRRVPALYVTELLRYVGLVVVALFVLPALFGNMLLTYLGILGAFLLYLPLVYVSFKLSMATEIVVLHAASPMDGFRRSFHLTEGRWERWLEMIVLSVVLVLVLLFLTVIGFLTVPGSSWNAWVAVGMLLVAAVLPVVQYAWTFFYLRLEESEEASVASASVHDPSPGAPGGGHRRGTAPQLRLVELERESDDERP